jgi:uncharacterized membrane protein
MQQQLHDWFERGLIDAETLERLEADLAGRSAGESAASVDSRARFSVGVWILFSLGTVALAAAVAVWFAREWGEWGSLTRVTLAITVPLLLGLAGVGLFRPGRYEFPAMGRVFLTLAAVATYSATVLLAATYDLHPRHATMTFVQAAIYAALAFTARSALLLWTGMILLVIGYGFEVDSAWMVEWAQRPVAFVGLGLVMIIAALLSRRIDRRLAENAIVAGAIVLFVALLTLSIDTSAKTAAVTARMWITLAVPYLAALAAVGYLWHRRGEASFERRAFVPLLSFLVLFTLASLWPERFGEQSWVDSTLFTLATLGGAYLGVSVRSALLINVSVVFFAIDVLRRYFDWFWDVLPGHIFFGTMGVILVGGGLALEKVRRRLVRRIEVAR